MTDINNNPTSATVDASTPELKNYRHLIELRRAKVTELWAQGLSQQRIAQELNVSQPLISLDIQWIREQAKEQIKSFVTFELPNTVVKARVTLDLITAKLWETVAQAERDRDEKTKIQALAAIQSAEMEKVEIASNVGIVDQVIIQAEKEQQTISSAVPTPEEESRLTESLIRDTKQDEDNDEEQPKAEDSE